MQFGQRSVIAVSLATVVAFLLAPALGASVAHAQLFGISEQEEIQIGRQVEADVAKKPGFVNDPIRLRSVTAIGLKLARVSERPNLPWVYHIVRDSSVNAFAAPGGFIFVTRGLVSFVKSNDELAFVLGHETTHVAHRHAVELAEREMQLRLGTALITRVLFGGSLTAYQLSQIASGVIGAKYSRDKEYEADHYGVIYAKRAGEDPRAAVSFLERLERLEQQPNAVGSAFASHPPIPDRIKAVRDELRQMGYRATWAGHSRRFESAGTHGASSLACEVAGRSARHLMPSSCLRTMMNSAGSSNRSAGSTRQVTGNRARTRSTSRLRWSSSG
jgi:predicted Zn-dependent protease